MTEKRMNNIVNLILKKYEGIPINSVYRNLIMRDLENTMKSLYKTEDFLNSVEIFEKERVIICHNPDDLMFLSFLPYINKILRGRKEGEELFQVYAEIAPNELCLQGCVSFIDTKLEHPYNIGYDIINYPSQFLGFYNTKTNEFSKEL